MRGAARCVLLGLGQSQQWGLCPSKHSRECLRGRLGALIALQCRPRVLTLHRLWLMPALLPYIATPMLVQVCMKEGAKGTQDAFYFLGSGCEPLRKGLGIEGLLLPNVLAAHVAGSIEAGGGAIDLGNEIVWDDTDGGPKLGAAAFLNHMSLLKVRRQWLLGYGCALVNAVRKLQQWRPALAGHCHRFGGALFTLRAPILNLHPNSTYLCYPHPTPQTPDPCGQACPARPRLLVQADLQKVVRHGQHHRAPARAAPGVQQWRRRVAGHALPAGAQRAGAARQPGV